MAAPGLLRPPGPADASGRRAGRCGGRLRAGLACTSPRPAAPAPPAPAPAPAHPAAPTRPSSLTRPSPRLQATRNSTQLEYESGHLQKLQASLAAKRGEADKQQKAAAQLAGQAEQMAAQLAALEEQVAGAKRQYDEIEGKVGGRAGGLAVGGWLEGGRAGRAGQSAVQG